MAKDEGLVGHEQHKSVGGGGEGDKTEDVTEGGKAPTLTASGPPGACCQGEVLEEGGGCCQALGVSSWKAKGTDSSSEKKLIRKSEPQPAHGRETSNVTLVQPGHPITAVLARGDVAQEE